MRLHDCKIIMGPDYARSELKETMACLGDFPCILLCAKIYFPIIQNDVVAALHKLSCGGISSPMIESAGNHITPSISMWTSKLHVARFRLTCQNVPQRAMLALKQSPGVTNLVKDINEHRSNYISDSMKLIVSSSP